MQHTQCLKLGQQHEVGKRGNPDIHGYFAWVNTCLSVGFGAMEAYREL
jgi:hypothetical protein